MEWQEIGSLMVVVAHPDDAEFGSAGTAARLAREGKAVYYVIVTDGSKGSSDLDMTPELLKSTRHREQLDAARVTGVSEVSFLEFPDGILEPSIDLRRAITGCIRKFKPDVVICQSPNRDLSMHVFAQHPDHLAAGAATLAAVYPSARDRMTFPELLDQGLEPHNVSEIWIAAMSQADLFVDITSTIDIKMEALRQHRSQIDPERVEKFVPDRARQMASGQDFDYAEGFKRLTIG